MANGEHPINGLMDVTLEKIRQMVDSNTIIGNPIVTADGTTILPVSKVTFGFTSGGSDFVSSKAPKDLFGGGSGAGVSMTPIAFLVLKDGNVRLLQLADKSGGTIDRALNMLPEVMDKISGLMGKGKTKGEERENDAAQTGGAAPAASSQPVQNAGAAQQGMQGQGVVMEEVVIFPAEPQV